LEGWKARGGVVTMPYAVDIAALTSLRVRNDLVLQMLLKQVIDLDPAHAIDPVGAGRSISNAALFVCDEERAEAIVKIIRRRYKPCELPLYHSKTGKGGWRSVKHG
jgi:hypothetical protein